MAMETHHWILLFLVVAATHLVGAVTLYGSTLMALPLLLLFMGDLATAVAILVTVGTVQAAHIFCYVYRDVDWHEFKRIMIFMGLGMPIGVLCVRYLPQAPLMIALGGLLIASGVSRFVPLPTGRNFSLPAMVWRLVLLAAGAIHGAFSCGGTLLVVYVLHRFTRKEPFRATLAAVWVVLGAVLLVTYLALGSFTPRAVVIGLIVLPPVLLGNWLGQRVAARLRQGVFVQIVALVLVMSGVITVLRAVQ